MPKRYFQSSRPHNSEVLAALGLRPGHRLPDAGSPGIAEIDGLRYRVLPKGQGLSQARRAHRTVAECPACGDWFCAGHIQQHIPACDSLEFPWNREYFNEERSESYPDGLHSWPSL